ncbi:hypothetical protein KKC88_04585 [Patescibacteria group bacterium]|nr:hypothetical protein [Patescibacteria group bacterium]MBU1674008.1 hypothetical protein [Patescibacteria group bacterium]MBU1963162.1 hypothetical protein [Patescibacteria group bacterium]
MEKVSEAEIKKLCQTIKNKLPKEKFDFYRSAVSIELIRRMIRNEWANQTLFMQHSRHPQQTEEARVFLLTKKMGFVHQNRVTDLAEMVYNMQHVEGIDSVVKHIKRGNLTSRFAELGGGAHFFRRNLPFEFVIADKDKDKDKNFDILLKTTPEIRCEVKNKSETTPYSEESIVKPCEKAAEQIRKENLGIIFLRVPQHWILKPGLAEMSIPVQLFLSSNKNILGVIISWEEQDNENRGKFSQMYFLIKNNIIAKEVEPIIQKFNRPLVNWIELDVYIKKYILA